MSEMEQIFDSFFGTPMITVTKKEAEEGCTKYNAMQVTISCKTCDGTGDKDKSDMHFCKNCNGKGSVTVVKKGLFGSHTNSKRCEDCNGTGRIVQNPCDECNGTGKVAVPLDVYIPAKTKNNDNIRLNTTDLTGNDSYITVCVK